MGNNDKDTNDMYLGKLFDRLLDYYKLYKNKKVSENEFLKDIILKDFRLSESTTFETVNRQLTSIHDRLSERMFFLDAKIHKNLCGQTDDLVKYFNQLKECDNDTQFDAYRNYVTAAFDIYESIFCIDGELVDSRLIQEEIIPGILNLGIDFNDENPEVSIFNPMVGQVLLFADKKFVSMGKNGELKNLTVLDISVYLLKTQRLLTELTFCDYKTQSVYKISEVDNDSYDVYPIKKLDNNERIEEIDVSRLAEKIYYAAIDKLDNELKQERKDFYNLNCLISDYESKGYDKKIGLLYTAIFKYFYDYNLKSKKNKINPHIKELHICTGKEKEISSSAIFKNEKYGLLDYEIKIDYVKPDKLIEKLNDDKYNLVFVLDSMYLYRPFSTSARKDESNFIGTLQRSRERKNYSAIFDDTGLKYYKNWTNFKSLYDRLAAMMIKPVTFNPKLNINVNEHIITYFKNALADNSNKFKIMYFYISNNEAFFKNRYEDYRFVRSERYNGKDVKIVRLANSRFNKQADRNGVIENEKSDNIFMDVSAYQFIKMYFSEEKIIKNVFDIPQEEDNFIDGLMNTVIRIQFDKIANNEIHYLDVKFILTKKYRYSQNVIRNLGKIFGKLAILPKNGEFDVLNACIRKGLFYSIIGRANKYEQILIAYFIKDKIEKLNISVSESSAAGQEDLYLDRAEYLSVVPRGVDNYTYMHNILDIISTFDRIYSNAMTYDLEFVYWKNNRTSKLEDELVGLMSACKKLGYTDSRLYYNLKSYYGGIK